MAEFLMPHLGADMTSGKLLAWRKQPGERVERGEIIADIETDKADVEVESFVTGTVERLVVEPGARVPVGTVLAIIRTEGEAETPVGAEVPVEPPKATAPPALPPLVEGARAEVARGGDRERIKASPVARKLADELGVDLSHVVGTGPGGRITHEDVQAAAVHTVSAGPELDRGARMRAAIAAAMSRSKREIPHYYLSSTVDVTRAMEWLAAENERRPVTERLLAAVLLLKAIALALREAPELNGLFEGGAARPSAAIHVGVAISLRQGGLVAPAIHDTDQRSLSELMAAFRDLVARARAGSLRGSEMSDPTITVTNLGDLGVDTVLGVIFPPQVALVGVGKVVERPWVVDGSVVPRRVVTISLSADHRVSDGIRGARFLAAVERLLQRPEAL